MTLEYRKYDLPRRRRYQNMGLTVWGKPRTRKPRPQLKGMDRRAYHTAYMKIWRKEKR